MRVKRQLQAKFVHCLESCEPKMKMKSRHTQLEDMRNQASEWVKNKNEEQIHRRLEEQRRRVKAEMRSRHTRLEDMRHRACEEVKNENEKQRHTRLEDMRHQAYERVHENKPGQQQSKRVKIENDSDDDWVQDFDMDKVINAYHTFVKKIKVRRMYFLMTKYKPR